MLMQWRHQLVAEVDKMGRTVSKSSVHAYIRVLSPSRVGFKVYRLLSCHAQKHIGLLKYGDFVP